MKIAIASGKGGTGKTTLSVNLAAYLSSLKYNVVLVDADVEEPNSGIFFKEEKLISEIKYKKIPEWKQKICTLCGKCREYCNFNAIITLPQSVLVLPELCHSCYACSELCPTGALQMINADLGIVNQFKINENLSFIEGIMDIGQESAVPLIKQTIEFVNKNLKKEDIILLDAPPGTSCPVIETVKDADFIILVTEPTPFGLHDLKLAVQTVQKLNKEFAVIINRYGLGNDEVEKYCSSNNIKIIAKIPNKREIAVLYSKGELLYDKIPEVKKELENIHDSLFFKVKFHS